MAVTAVEQVKEACMCKGFGSTLSGLALRWFVSLSNRNVEGGGETIGEYNTRFNNEKVAVRECDVSTVVEAFRRGLHHESYVYKQLTMHPCHSFEAVQEKAAAAIRLEEDILARVSIPSTPSISRTSAMEKSSRKKSTRTKDERYRPYGRGVNKVDNREENQQLPTLAEYGFTTSVGGILKALREMGDRGELSHLLPRGDKQQDKVGSINPATPPKCTKIINVITGGSDISGLTYSAAKRRATETKGDRLETSCRISHSDLPAVAFDEGDVCDEQEHHDALIITLPMANCTVRKVLVDTEASIEQIKAVLQLESPEKPKDVQRLASKVAALSRFISRSSDKCRLFYDILRKSQKFEWTAEHEKAFRELKHYLAPRHCYQNRSQENHCSFT
ncbi:uncharacterized protein LOC141607891 [Silene latifolia]|uniref:uncharacterized protein LOC141607891 n=1 Tax=Silene latifolia TaxID=37657 RepID=UPI003D774366